VSRVESNGIGLGTALTVLSIAFGVWAWVVAWGVSVVRKEVQDMKTAAANTGSTLTAHVNQTERRLTMLETEFGWIKSGIRPSIIRELDKP
jgi:cell division protein FtsB